jgi:hypothetical protein
MYLYSFSLIFFTTLAAAVYPITFSIPEEKIVISVPQKEWDFAPLVPGDLSTYIYDDEESYRKDYQRSYYAFTKIKGGADCMRHHEILANGCIPYFTDLEQVHPMTMTHFPKELVKEAMHLPGVEAGRIDHAIFDKKRYFEILEKLLQHTRKHLTCRKMAQYILEKIGKPNPKKVLFFSDSPYPDYMREMSYIGFKQILKDRCDFYPKLDYLYQDYDQPTEKLYGKGFSYTKILAPQKEIARSDMWSNLKKGAYDLVIIGSIHRVPLSWIRVMNRLGVEIVNICGEDFDSAKNYHDCCFRELDHLFVREYTSILS